MVNNNGVISHIGATIRLEERNGYSDSDFYAIVWDEETQTVKKIMYDTTRFGGSGSAEVDVTSENLKKANIYVARCSYYENLKKGYLKDLKVGNLALVIGGRKVKKGLTVKVLDIKDNQFDRFNKSVLVELPDGQKIWTYEKNLKVVDLTINQKINIKADYFKKAGIF